MERQKTFNYHAPSRKLIDGSGYSIGQLISLHAFRLRKNQSTVSGSISTNAPYEHVLCVYACKACLHPSHYWTCNIIINCALRTNAARQHRSYEPHHHAGSDSDEDMLRRLRVQQHTASSSLHSGISSLSSHPLLSNYGGGGTTTPVAVTAASTSAVAVTAAVAAAASAAAAAAAAAGPTAAAGNYAAARHQQMMIRIPHTQYQQQRRMPEACHDPLGVAERGKVGLPPSSSECSSNSSSVVDAALDSGTMGGGLKKGTRMTWGHSYGISHLKFLTFIMMRV